MFLGPRDIFRVSLCFCVAFHCTYYEFGRGGWNSFRGKELSGKQSLMLRRLSRALSLFQIFLAGVRLVVEVCNFNLSKIYMNLFKIVKMRNLWKIKTSWSTNFRLNILVKAAFWKLPLLWKISRIKLSN